ncbi:early activation antigen CD69-like [Thomomys bottae]
MNTEDCSGTEDSSFSHLERGPEKRVLHSHSRSRPEGSIQVPIPVAVAFVVFPTILIIALVALSVGKYNCPDISMASVPAGSWHSSCSHDWIAYQKKCYLLSTITSTWPMAQRSCSKNGATLAVIDSAKDMIFLKRYAGSTAHWIGLKNQANQQWKETNGRGVNHRVNVTEAERCEFLNSTDMGQADCEDRLPWICSKDIR